jgi:hypothetical protein
MVKLVDHLSRFKGDLDPRFAMLKASMKELTQRDRPARPRTKGGKGKGGGGAAAAGGGGRP